MCLCTCYVYVYTYKSVFECRQPGLKISDGPLVYRSQPLESRVDGLEMYTVLTGGIFIAKTVHR